ncbi:winged helix-turn-helix transcriptional regulator [Kitasatospora sp. NPDC057965]|uniref:winged helix-turn-helix transcriptional regulator n=1 Tax=Kitasatospora sp. NPDC057965 TaxID=3346291 RepID=UPI0036DE9A26
MSEQPLTEFPRTDAQQVEAALRRLAPKWTTHVVHTIAKYGPEMRWRDISQHLPGLIPTNLSKRLAGMAEAGLLNRDAEFDRWAPFRLSSRARTLGPVYRELVQWSADHLDGAPTSRYDRIEDALQRLQLTDTTTVIRLLTENRRMRFTHLAESAGLPLTALTSRLHRLQEDGVIARTGPRHGDPYTLTAAGRALGPVYAAVQKWDDRHTAAHPAPVPTATRTLGADPSTVRTAAALRRSTAPPSLFSHAQQPQPRVPAAATSASHPSRGR